MSLFVDHSIQQFLNVQDSNEKVTLSLDAINISASKRPQLQELFNKIRNDGGEVTYSEEKHIFRTVYSGVELSGKAELVCAVIKYLSGIDHPKHN